MDRVHQRGFVLGTIQGAFSGASSVLGGLSPQLSVSFPSLFIIVSFILNGVLWVSTCPISPSLQLLGVVVKAEEHGYVRHKAPNAIMAAFPSDISIFRCSFLL